MPARVVEVRGETALVDCGGYVREVDAILLPDVRVGDYVIIHAGAIIARIDEKEAVELIKLWSEVARAASSPD